MIRSWGPVLVVCGLFAIWGDRAGYGQTAPAFEPFRCSNWSQVPWDRRGSRRQLFPVQFGLGPEPVRRPGQFVKDGQFFTGSFVAAGDFWVSLISEPSGTRPTNQFIT